MCGRMFKKNFNNIEQHLEQDFGHYIISECNQQD